MDLKLYNCSLYNESIVSTNQYSWNCDRSIYQLRSKNEVRRYPEKTGDLVRMLNIQWSGVHAGDAYESVTYYSPVAQTWIRRKETDDQMMSWFAATVTESKLTEVSCCLFTYIPKNWFA